MASDGWGTIARARLRTYQRTVGSAGAAQKRSQLAWKPRRFWEIRPGLRRYLSATSRVRSPAIRSRISRWSRSLCVESQLGQAMRTTACSSGGVFGLSCSASSRTLPTSVLLVGSELTVKPFRRRARGDRTSRQDSFPHTRRPERAARQAKVARAEGKAEVFLPRSTRRRNQRQARATASTVGAPFQW